MYLLLAIYIQYTKNRTFTKYGTWAEKMLPEKASKGRTLNYPELSGESPRHLVGLICTIEALVHSQNNIGQPF